MAIPKKTSPARQKTSAKKKPEKKQPPARGNKELDVIFKTLRPLLKAYEPPFTSRANSDSGFDLWSEKEVMFAGKLRKEVYFAAVMKQGNYVGFYYMPIYIEPAITAEIKPELLKTLKGKSCFHIRKLDEKVLQQIKDALKSGLALYKKRGWV